MRSLPELGGCNYSAGYIECETRKQTLGSDIWTFIKPIPYDEGSEGDIHGIHIPKNPLERLAATCHDEKAKAIMKYLFDLAELWLDSDASDPLDVLTSFRLENENRLSDLEGTLEASDDVEHRIAQIILDHIEKVSDRHTAYFRSENKVDTTFHLRWVEAYNEQHNSVALDLSTRNRLLAFIRIMRNPGPYDGGSDYIFERYMNIVISMLLEPEDICWVADTMTWYNDIMERADFPLIVIAGNCPYTAVIQRDMALAAKSILDNLTKLEASVERKVVWGIHWDHVKLRIIAHFMNHTDPEYRPQWHFCQVVVAQHFISLDPDSDAMSDHTEDDTFLQRWRLTCALFTIRREIEVTKSKLQSHPDYPANESAQGIRQQTNLDVIRVSITNPYLTSLRRYWRGDTNFNFEIPAEWMPEVQMPIRKKSVSLADITRHLVPQLAKVLLARVRHILGPIPKKELQRLISKDHEYEYRGPDFTHHLNVPRSTFPWIVLGVDRLATTEPHLTKLYDVLSLSVAYDRDINICIADTFACLSGYKVNWRPLEFQVLTTIPIFIDFVLTPDPKDGSQPNSVPHIPLFFGLYLNTRDTSHVRVSTEDIEPDIKSILGGHLRRLNEELNQNPGILFCSLVAGQGVHIFGAELVENNVILHHVDSLQTEDADRDAELLERTRLAMLLFTLKRHVFKLAKELGGDMETHSPPAQRNPLFPDSDSESDKDSDA
ncbi:hypothetical protein QCA50_004017 [Cerrena zonata]|uniref:Uncharacterized protein n=1 Tax=Cerrena zonata TaxID=2478898 RepID=A0AAW0GI96_9APHY